MDIEFKRYLPQILPLILKQLQNEISSCALNDSQASQSQVSNLNAIANTNTLKILNLLRLCTCCLENYVHLILSQFADYLNMQDLQVKQEIMLTIYTFARQITLSDNCAILFQSFIKILEQYSSTLPAPSNHNFSNTSLQTPQSANSQQQHQS
jgi:hypothetical protein